MKIKFFATYRAITRCSETNLPAEEDILSLLHEVSRIYPGLRNKILNSEGTDIGLEAIILVNGRNIVHLNGVDTKITDDDTVALFPLVAGG
ncbi:MoaD family protein [Methanorbis rubei]|uniref:Molybdopterin synthase sulfur carrier subunit n=1 Tax=Methanorbis rubei TaxID=3028300 RepID=A0AAE4MH37_9EURY|nr:hypothetical protein [Methanocorpusculaceae archaeon Cs1]